MGGHPRLAPWKLSVNISEPVGTPAIGFPLGQCFFCHREVGGVFERLDRGGPGGCNAGRHDRGNAPTAGVSEIDHLYYMNG